MGKHQKARENVPLQMELLRAKLGSKPNLKVAQIIANPKGGKNYRSVDEQSTIVPKTKDEARVKLQQLSAQRRLTKAFHRCKQLRQTIKKTVKLECVKMQKSIKKLIDGNQGISAERNQQLRTEMKDVDVEILLSAIVEQSGLEINEEAVKHLHISSCNDWTSRHRSAIVTRLLRCTSVKQSIDDLKQALKFGEESDIRLDKTANEMLDAEGGAIVAESDSDGWNSEDLDNVGIETSLARPVKGKKDRQRVKNQSATGHGKLSTSAKPGKGRESRTNRQSSDKLGGRFGQPRSTRPGKHFHREDGTGKRSASWTGQKGFKEGHREFGRGDNSATSSERNLYSGRSQQQAVKATGAGGKELHPSWAQRKAVEQSRQAEAQKLAAKRTHVTFDD